MRKSWLDSLKGTCIFLVVLFHFSMWYASQNIDGTVWLSISAALEPVRMPTFFFISGILSLSSIIQPKKGLIRSGNLYFIYIFWTTLMSFRLFVPAARGDGLEPTLSLLLYNAIIPGLYWYLFALSIYYILSMCTLRLSPFFIKIVLTLSFLVSLASPQISVIIKDFAPQPLEVFDVRKLCANYFWFLLGLLLSERLPIININVHGKRRNFSSLIYGILLLAVIYFSYHVHLGADRIPEFLSLSISALSILLILNFFSSTSHHRWHGIFEYIGRGTLPVYIFHGFVLSFLSLLSIILRGTFSIPTWFGMIAPIGLAVVTTLICRILGNFILSSRILSWSLKGPL